MCTRRGAELGDALLHAIRLAPLAFTQLSLTDIQDALLFWRLPPDFLKSNLASIVCATGALLFSSDQRLKDFLASPHVPIALLKLVAAASARFTAHNVYFALQNAPPYSLLHGAAYFVLKMRFYIVGNERLPLCFMMAPKHLGGELGFDYFQANTEHNIEFFEFIHAAKSGPHANGSKPQIECMGEGIDYSGAFDNHDLMVMMESEEMEHLSSYACVSPVMYPAFCDALKQELLCYGLQVSWHSADITLVVDNMNAQEVRGSDFLCVSWV